VLRAMISMRTVNLKAAHRGRNSMVSTNSDVTCICPFVCPRIRFPELLGEYRPEFKIEYL
jgi:hypothetical protein